MYGSLNFGTAGTCKRLLLKVLLKIVSAHQRLLLQVYAEPIHIMWITPMHINKLPKVLSFDQGLKRMVIVIRGLYRRAFAANRLRLLLQGFSLNLPGASFHTLFSRWSPSQCEGHSKLESENFKWPPQLSKLAHLLKWHFWGDSAVLSISFSLSTALFGLKTKRSFSRQFHFRRCPNF